jgi:hypothetical protein
MNISIGLIIILLTVIDIIGYIWKARKSDSFSVYNLRHIPFIWLFK